jgi:phosphoglycolate phosphatase
VTAPRGLRLLVFDWDGTLIDSVASIVACTRRTLEDLELDGHLTDGDIRGAIGLGLRETVEHFLPGATAEHFRRVVDCYRRHWLDTFHSLSEPFAGAEETLSELREAGYLLAVATAKSRAGLDRDLGRTGLAPLFHTTRTADETASKPDPAMLVAIMEELEVPPDATLMVGDTGYDLEMAARARAGAVAVACGAQGRAELERWSPLACLESVAELPPWLGQLGPILETGRQARSQRGRGL